MSLIEAKGNMYTWVTHEYRPILGICPHKCVYCYVTAIMKRYGSESKPMRLKESELKINLGSGKTIFVCSTFDMFADEVPSEWILAVLNHCQKYPENKYLFQSKNPKRIHEYIRFIPKHSIIGTTIETNREYNISKAPTVEERAHYMSKIDSFEKIVTIEPILDFDLDKMVILIRMCEPKWVNIGADSKGHGLIEPSKEKIIELITEIKKFTEIRNKHNLKRIIG